MLTSEDFNVLQESLTTLCAHLWEQGRAMDPQKILGPGPVVKFSGVIFLGLGKTCLRPGTVTDKVQQFPTPKIVEEIQTFVGPFGYWRAFIPHLAQ